MPNAISPAEELKQLQADLKQLLADAERIKSRIADITKTAGDIEQKNKDFEKAAAANDKAAAQIQEYIDCKKKVLEAKVDKDKIAKTKKDAEDALAVTKKAADDAAQAVRDKEAALAEAKSDAADKQKIFEEVSKRGARNAEILKELETLRTAIEKQADNPSRAYFLLLVMMDRLKELKLTKPEDYAKELDDAGAAVNAALQAQRTAEADLDAAKTAEKAAAKKYQDDKAKWLDATLNTIPAGAPAAGPAQPPEPAQPAPPPPATPQSDPGSNASAPS